MELEALRSRQVEIEEEIREAIEKSKDAQFEETVAHYMQQVKQIKVVVFKRDYDVALADAGVLENSPLWANFAYTSEQMTLPPSMVEDQACLKTDKVTPTPVVEEGAACSSAAEQIPLDFEVPK
ncbi:hypothetical protein AAC387_Pa03g2387 [Persea americana]